MAITLDDVVLANMETNETLGMLVDKTNILIEMEGDSFAGLELLNEQFEDFLGLVRKEYGLAAEARREENGLKPPVQDEESPVKKPEKEELPSFFGDVPILTIGAGLVGFAANFVKGFALQTEKLINRNIFNPIRSMFTFIGDKFKSLGNFFKKTFDMVKGFFRLDIADDVAKFVEPFKPFLDKAKEFGKSLANNPLVRGLKSVGKLLGRFAAPLVAIYELFTNITEEFAKSSGGFLAGLGALTRGIFKAVVDFFAIFLDIPKDIISWFAGLVGLEKVENFLDSFTFAGVFDYIIDLIGDVVSLISGFFGVDGLEISDAGQQVASVTKSFLPKMIPPDFLEFEVPSVEVFGKTFGGGSINLNPIPDEWYAAAGIDAPEGSSSITSNDTTTNNVSTVEGTEVIGGDALSSENIEVLRQRFNAESLQAINEENQITNAINTESVTNVGSSQGAPVIIQDNSVNSTSESNVNQSVQSQRSMRSPTLNNGTRASAYAS